MYVCIWGHYTHVSLLCQLRMPKSNDTSAQTLLSNPILHYNEPRFLGEMAESRSGARNRQHEPGASCSARKKGSAQKRTKWLAELKGPRSQLKVFNGQSYNLSKRTE